MKVCIDARCLMGGRRTGVEEYTLGLLGELLKLDKKNEYIIFFNSWKNPKFDFNVFLKYPNVKIKRLKLPNKVLNFLFCFLDWPKIDRLSGRADIVFLPNIVFGSLGARSKLVATIHDLSFERHPEYFSLKRRLWHFFVSPRKICRRANKIIAVSESTQNDLIDLYKIKKNKIATIHSAIGDKFRVMDRNNTKLLKVKEKYKLPYKFIFFLGTIEPRKNISGLIRAFNSLQNLASREKEFSFFEKYQLVLAGEKGWKSEGIFKEFNQSPHKDKIKIIRSVPEEEKEYLYNLASLFVYPSFFEGFGFPPLEAAKCGIPVICSNNSSLPEVMENGAILIDPYKPDEIARAIREVLSNTDLRLKMIKRGIAQAEKFSWKNTAQKFLKTINSL